jgi:hypothetical protein
MGHMTGRKISRKQTRHRIFFREEKNEQKRIHIIK